VMGGGQQGNGPYMFRAKSERNVLIDTHRSQQISIMEVMQDLAESFRQSEINRAADLRLIQNEIKETFEALRLTNNPPPMVGDEGATVVRTVWQWIRGFQSNFIGFSDNTIRRPVDNLILALSRQARQAKAYKVERAIIRGLTFKVMADRQAEIKRAHSETCEWIFSPSAKRPSADHFAEWLKDGDGIFWVGGKPGSGKSTLMKYIYNNVRTKQMLAQWSGDSTLVTACFYFWAGGTFMQNSIDGLLQSMVCQVLRQCPSLIPTAFPKEWNLLMEPGPEDVSFQREDLIKAIKSLTTAEDLKHKFCFFIDGLDEYDGYDRDVATLMRTLALSPFVKICLASRPHNAFVDAFGGSPNRMLYVHEFTDWDIQLYVKDILESNSEFTKRMDQDPDGYGRLVEYIRKEANGVFFWVYLVSMQLLNGMENADRMSDLQRKLEKVPKDLKALFAYILDSVDEADHEQQAKMLYVACQATAPLDLIAYSFLDEEDPEFAVGSPVRAMESEKVVRRCADMRKRIVARCKLLLEVVEAPSTGLDSGSQILYFGTKVNFLHRTVVDYLRESEAQQLLASRLKTPFDPRREICNMLLAQLKFSHGHLSPQIAWANDGTIHERVVQFFFQARALELLTNQPAGNLVNQLQTTIVALRGEAEIYWWQPVKSYFDPKAPIYFLRLVIRNQLHLYLEWKLKTCHLEFIPTSAEMAYLLACALEQQVDTKDWRISNANTVKMLLDGGANPNYDLYHREVTTPWHHFLLLLNEDYVETGGLQYPVWDRKISHIIQHCILGGADLTPFSIPTKPKSTCSYWEWKIRTVEESIQQSISSENAKYLINLVQRQRRKYWFRGWFW
jgi:hypothetical protein